MKLTQRLERLEAATGGGCVYVDTRPLTSAQAELAIAQAEQQVGKAGTVIIVRNVDRHPLPPNAPVLLRVQSGYWDKL